MRRVLPFLTTMTGEVVALVALMRLGRAPGFAIPFGHLGSWLGTAPPVDAVAATLRLVALGVACWLLASTVVYTVALATRRAAAARAAGWMTLPVVRRAVERALAVSIAATGVLGTAAAPVLARTTPGPAPTTTTTAAVRTGRAGDPGAVEATATVPEAPAPAAPTTTAPAHPAEPAPSSSPGPIPRAAAPAPPVAGTDTATHVVVAGDNLWDIAAARVAAVSGRPRATLGDSEIATYWVRVCDANRSRLRSGDPDLIYAGEVVELPPL